MKYPLVKQQLSFLDYPVWFQGQQKKRERNSDGELVLTDIDGYIYRAGYKLPNEMDILFLYYLLLRSQQEDYKQTMEFTRYEILKACGLPTEDSKGYDRLEDSLKRWKNISLEFKGTFYDGKKYHVISFGIINDYKIRDEDKKLEIEFNRHWLLKIKNTPSFKLINFLYMKALRRPLSRRLYEYLSPKFYMEETFSIGLVRLGNKLGLTGRPVETRVGVKYVIYASDVLVKVKGAVGEINRLAKNHKLMEDMGIKQEEAFDLSYTTAGKGNERSITFTKVPIEGYTPKPKRGRRGKLPFQIAREEAIQKSTDKQYQEAMAWIRSIPGFHKTRLKDIEKLSPKDVALAYPSIRDKYTKGEEKSPGWVFEAFMKKWHLKEAKLEADKAKTKQDNSAKIEEIQKKKEEEENRLWSLTDQWIEKYGGKGKAIYLGCKVLFSNPSLGGLVLETPDGERKVYSLKDVREEEFKRPS